MEDCELTKNRMVILQSIIQQSTNVLVNSRLFKTVKIQNKRLEEVVEKRTQELEQEIKEYEMLFQNSVEGIIFNEFVFSDGPERHVI